jgi:hypothetical protein
MERQLFELQTASRLENTCNPARGGVYAWVNRDGRVEYVGRTNDIQARRQDYRNDPRFRGMTFRELAQTNVYAEQRGLEQRAIDRYGARSVTGRPDQNRIEGISPNNPLYDVYRNASDYFPRLDPF